MTDNNHKLFAYAMMATAVVMALLVISYFVRGLPTVSLVLSIGVIFFEITAPFEILKRLGLRPRDCHIYAHNIDTMLDYCFPPFARGRAKPDLLGIRRELLVFLLVSLIIFSVYVPAYWAYFSLNAVKHHAELIISWNVPPKFFFEIITQIFVVALPEEIFYRGFLQSALIRRFPHHRSFFGHASLSAIVLTNLIFAIGHVASTLNPTRMLTFFPGLVFSYLVVRNKSLLAAILFHAACNIVGQILYASFYLK